MQVCPLAAKIPAIDTVHRRVQVGVVEDDVGRLPAQLQADARQVVSRIFHHRDADLGRAGEGDLIHPWVAHQRRGPRSARSR